MSTSSSSEKTFYALVEGDNREDINDCNLIHLINVKTWKEAEEIRAHCRTVVCQIDYWNGSRWIDNVTCDQS
jgi:hypothetical protein